MPNHYGSVIFDIISIHINYVRPSEKNLIVNIYFWEKFESIFVLSFAAIEKGKGVKPLQTVLFCLIRENNLL